MLCVCFLPTGNEVYTGKWVTVSPVQSSSGSVLSFIIYVSFTSRPSSSPFHAPSRVTASHSFFPADWHICVGDRRAEEGDGSGLSCCGQGSCGATRVSLFSMCYQVFYSRLYDTDLSVFMCLFYPFGVYYKFVIRWWGLEDSLKMFIFFLYTRRQSRHWLILLILSYFLVRRKHIKKHTNNQQVAKVFKSFSLWQAGERCVPAGSPLRWAGGWKGFWVRLLAEEDERVGPADSNPPGVAAAGGQRRGGQSHTAQTAARGEEVASWDADVNMSPLNVFPNI